MTVRPRGAPDPWQPLRAALLAQLEGHHKGRFAERLGITRVHLSRVLHGPSGAPGQLLEIAALLGLQISLHDSDGHVLATARAARQAS